MTESPNAPRTHSPANSYGDSCADSDDAFYTAQIRAESTAWPDWTFSAHQATTQAAAAEQLTALRRQYTDLTEPELLRLANSWRADDVSGPYFPFTAADVSPTHTAVDATFVKALIHELDDQAPNALAALLDLWAEQRGHATYAGLLPTPSQPPRVALLLPRDLTTAPPNSWATLRALDLAAPTLDHTTLQWDTNSANWHPTPQHS